MRPDEGWGDEDVVLMPWRQQRLAGAKAAWGVLWSSDQDLECSENSDPDVSGH